MDKSHNQHSQTLEEHREYLLLLARLELGRNLQGKVDASGVVQQTMLEAFRALPQYEHQDAAHMAAWLRRILATNLADEIRKARSEKRDVARELSLEGTLQQSSYRLESLLVGRGSSPSLRVRTQERSVELASALAKLPEAQKEALLLRFFEELSLTQIAERMNKSEAAVAGLLKRGLQHLREQIKE